MPKTRKNKQKAKPQSVLERSPRPVAVEDLLRGDYVAVADEDTQFIPLFCDDVSGRAVRRVQRLAYVPYDAGKPRRVVRVAPPFVLVREPDGQHDTLDLRLTRLLRLSKRYGRVAFRRMDPAYKKRKRRKK